MGVALQRRVLVVVEAGAAQLLVIKREPQRLDQVQATAGVGGQPDDIAGVGRLWGLQLRRRWRRRRRRICVDLELHFDFGVRNDYCKWRQWRF